jgi:ADP-ribosylglycohydrolase
LRVEAWQAAGVVRPWATGFALADGTFKRDGETRLCGVSGMTAIAKHLARGLDVRVNAKVTRVRAGRDGWVVTTEAGERFSGRALLLTPPVPQSLQLLAGGEVPLPEQAQYWGQRGIHYHQFLRAGENTLNLQLGQVLIESLIAGGGYDADDYLKRYIDFMLTPGRHRDTYVEECHRKFFTAYARVTHPRKCGGNDIHIGGLAHVGVLSMFPSGEAGAAREAVREHVPLTHRDPEVLKAADALVQILGTVLAGGGLREAIFEHGSDWLSRRTAAQWSREPDDVVIGHRVSPACYIADAFPASLYLAWKYADDFEAGVIANANVGGDNCHRGTVVGALLGAAAGTGRIPARFCDGLHDAATLRRQMEKLAPSP